jgi:DNA end-binding protein Ku
MARKSHGKAAPSEARRRRPGAAEDAGDEGEGRGRTKDIWKGTIAFGLVEIPVAIVSAERSKGIKLSFLDQRDFSPVGYKRFNKLTEEEVPWDQIVRGYEYEKGQYVVLTPQDLERASPELAKTIQILYFVDAAEIDPIYYERPYYLEPLNPRGKGYVLLRETLKRTGRLGIAKVAIRAREHVAALGVRGDALILYLLRFPDEVRDAKDLDNVKGNLRDAHVEPKEIEIAERLVEDMGGEWNPAEFTDEYSADLMKLVEERVASGNTHVIDETEAEAPPSRGGGGQDLMQLLKQSLEGTHRGGRRTARAAPTSRTRERTRSRHPPRRARRGA